MLAGLGNAEAASGCGETSLRAVATSAASASAACGCCCSDAACFSGGSITRLLAHRAAPLQPWRQQQQGSRGFAAAAAAAARKAPAWQTTSSSSSASASASPQPAGDRPRRVAPEELEAMPFSSLAAHLTLLASRSPVAEEKLALLARKASSADELSEAIGVALANRARASRQAHYAPHSAKLLSALLQVCSSQECRADAALVLVVDDGRVQTKDRPLSNHLPYPLLSPHPHKKTKAAKRVGAPPVFYPKLLADANLLGLPLSGNAAEAVLAGAAGDAAAFDEAYARAAALLGGRPTKHMLFMAARAMSERGDVSRALRAAREFEAAGGGALPPALAKLVEELRARRSDEARRRREERQKAQQEQQPAGGEQREAGGGEQQAAPAE